MKAKDVEKILQTKGFKREGRKYVKNTKTKVVEVEIADTFMEVFVFIVKTSKVIVNKVNLNNVEVA